MKSLTAIWMQKCRDDPDNAQQHDREYYKQSHNLRKQIRDWTAQYELDEEVKRKQFRFFDRVDAGKDIDPGLDSLWTSMAGGSAAEADANQDDAANSNLDQEYDRADLARRKLMYADLQWHIHLQPNSQIYQALKIAYDRINFRDSELRPFSQRTPESQQHIRILLQNIAANWHLLSAIEAFPDTLFVPITVVQDGFFPDLDPSDMRNWRLELLEALDELASVTVGRGEEAVQRIIMAVRDRGLRREEIGGGMHGWMVVEDVRNAIRSFMEERDGRLKGKTSSTKKLSLGYQRPLTVDDNDDNGNNDDDRRCGGRIFANNGRLQQREAALPMAPRPARPLILSTPSTLRESEFSSGLPIETPSIISTSLRTRSGVQTRSSARKLRASGEAENDIVPTNGIRSSSHRTRSSPKARQSTASSRYTRSSSAIGRRRRSTRFRTDRYREVKEWISSGPPTESDVMRRLSPRQTRPNTKAVTSDIPAQPSTFSKESKPEPASSTPSRRKRKIRSWEDRNYKPNYPSKKKPKSGTDPEFSSSTSDLSPSYVISTPSCVRPAPSATQSATTQHSATSTGTRTPRSSQNDPASDDDYAPSESLSDVQASISELEDIRPVTKLQARKILRDVPDEVVEEVEEEEEEGGNENEGNGLADEQGNKRDDDDYMEAGRDADEEDRNSELPSPLDSFSSDSDGIVYKSTRPRRKLPAQSKRADPTDLYMSGALLVNGVPAGEYHDRMAQTDSSQDNEEDSEMSDRSSEENEPKDEDGYADSNLDEKMGRDDESTYDDRVREVEQVKRESGGVRRIVLKAGEGLVITAE